ncbi:MAG: hypothetical protein DRP84_06785 [Spirochaetes bacterium]|nr:MAG: hypothetical protein DRP84_06785 [Spirochaetota bacterium]
MGYHSNNESTSSIFMVPFVQLIMLLLLILAFTYHVTELGVFSLIILVIGIGSYLWSRVSLHKIKFTIKFDKKRLFPNEVLKIEIQVTNSKLLPVLFKTRLFIPGMITGSNEGQWVSEETVLFWYQRASFSREYIPKKRGVYNVGSPLLRGGDIFGFSFKNILLNNTFEIVVYPRIVNICSVKFHKREFFGIPELWSPVKDPVYIYGTRDYQKGNPARDIHWKASARHNRLQEKLYEPTVQTKLLILLDVENFDSEGQKENFERILEIIASMIVKINRSNIPVGFITNGHVLGDKSKIIPISRSPQQMTLILETLARVGIKNDGYLLDILSKGYNIPWGTSCIYFGYDHGKQTLIVKEFMNNRKHHIWFILAKKDNKYLSTNNTHNIDTFYLNDILIEENQKYEKQ